MVHVNDFLRAAEFMTRYRFDLHTPRTMATFRSLFGVSPLLCVLLWQQLKTNHLIPNKNSVPMHLLWALLLMKVYPCERVGAILCFCSENTFRQHSWKFISALAQLPAVSCYCTMHCLSHSINVWIFYFID